MTKNDTTPEKLSELIKSGFQKTEEHFDNIGKKLDDLKNDVAVIHSDLIAHDERAETFYVTSYANITT